jgi:hypothetical protein
LGRTFCTPVIGGSPEFGCQCSIDFGSFPCFYMFLPHKMAVGQRIFKWKILHDIAKVIPMWRGWFWVDSGIFATFEFCNIFYLEMLLVAPPKMHLLFGKTWIYFLIVERSITFWHSSGNLFTVLFLCGQLRARFDFR